MLLLFLKCSVDLSCRIWGTKLLTFYCRQLRPDIQIISLATHERGVDKFHMAGVPILLCPMLLWEQAVL